MNCTDCDSTDIYAKNKCKKCYKREYDKKYNETKRVIDTEARKQTNAKYYKNNKDKRKAYKEKNKEQIQKVNTIYNWRRNGLIDSDDDNYEKIYQRYLDTSNCDLCNVILTYDRYQTSTTKCMDHNHETKLFRNIVCHKCNTQLGKKEKSDKSNARIKNIYYCNRMYIYKKMIDGERYQKNFKTIGGALAHKIIHNVLLNRSI